MSAGSGTVLCDLAYQGLIGVSGADAASFLQGQFTSDVREVTPGHSQLSAWCTPKGRVLACFRLFQREDAYYLRLPQGLVGTVLERLRKYRLRAQVILVEVGAEWGRLGLTGADAGTVLATALGDVPARVDEVTHARELTVIRLPGEQPRFEVHGPAAPLAALRTTLAAGTTLADADAWRLLDILAGIPTVYPETSEAFLPQMLNLQLLGGVSFRKGCYAGQEIVARTQHLGRLKRRLYRARLCTTLPPQPGDQLFAVTANQDSESVATVVDSCRQSDDSYAVLVVAPLESAEKGAVQWGNIPEISLVFETLPYALNPVNR
jgi:folate-binding protein YgfZ